uniref:Calponin-homology (CH) domain-containing protein n=1 Tax=Leishmania utingensis TaxID=653362 RepID=A0AAW2ZWL1_9TRYP
MSESKLIGKAELLAWAAYTTGISPCGTYRDLKDGLIYLALARQLFPGEIDNGFVRLQRRGARDATKNWSLLTSCLRRHGIPTHLCSRQAVERGHTRHCFNLLVLFYFLVRLARGDQFAVNFAQPVDPELAAFLQSPESLLAVDSTVDVGFGKGSTSSVRVPAVADTEADGRADSGVPLSLTRLSFPSSVASVSTTAAQVGSMALPHCSTSLLADNSSTHLTPLPQRTWACEWSLTRTPSDAAVWRAPHNNSSRETEDLKHFPSAAYHSTLAQGVARAPAPCGGELATAPLSPPPSLLCPSPFTTHTPHLYRQNQLLREELQDVKAFSQLLLEQKRGLEVAAEMRASAALREQVAKAELNHLRHVRQVEATLTAASVQDDGATATPSPQQWAALAHRAEAAEATAEQLYRECRESQQAYDSALQHLRQVFCTITDIAAAALSSGPSTSAYAGVDAYEETVTAAMMAQLTGAPPVLKDAFHAQLQALLLALASLRSTNARLQQDAASGPPSRHFDDAGRDCAPSLSALHASSLPFVRESLKTACTEARSACQGASPDVQHALQRLTHIVDVLSSDLDAVQQDQDRSEQRCSRAKTTTAQVSAASQRVCAEGETQGQQVSNTRAADLSCLSQEGRARAEQSLQENRRLSRQVQEVLTMAFSPHDSHSMQWANDELVALLGAYVKARTPYSAMEEALAEQAETIATLLSNLRQQREARERAEAQLSDDEQRRQVLEHKCAALQAQLYSATEKLDTQRCDSKACATTPHRAQRDKASSSSSLTALAIAPLAKLSAIATHDAEKHMAVSDTALLAYSSRHVSSTPNRGTSHALYSSPHLPGALRSLATSDDHVDDVGEHRPVDHQHGFHTDLHHHHVSPSSFPSASLSLSSSNVATAGADVPNALRTEQAVVGACLAAPTTSQVRSTRLSTDPLAVASGPSLLLSAAELERRKQAILRKYDMP